MYDILTGKNAPKWGVIPLSLEGGLHPLGLERRSRSITPPAASEKHLSLSANDSVRYRLKIPYRDGAAHVIFEPLDHRTIRHPWRRRPVAARSTAACYMGDPRDSDSFERKAGLYYLFPQSMLRRLRGTSHGSSHDPDKPENQR